MFELVTSTFFSISANIDNIPIGLSYGIKKVHISIFKNIFICLITSIFTFISMSIGSNISKFLDIKIANIIGSILLIILGIYPILNNFFKKRKMKKIKKKKKIINSKDIILKNNSICIKEILVIVVTLSLNNIAAGIAASITGINTFYTTLCTFIFGSIFLYIGNNLGKKIKSEIIIRYSELISSLMLFLLGIIEIFI